jgi:hypothetical protein
MLAASAVVTEEDVPTMADLGSVLRNNPGVVAADGSMYDEFNAGLACDVDVVLIRKGLFLGLPELGKCASGKIFDIVTKIPPLSSLPNHSW